MKRLISLVVHNIRKRVALISTTVSMHKIQSQYLNNKVDGAVDMETSLLSETCETLLGLATQAHNLRMAISNGIYLWFVTNTDLRQE